MLSEYNFGMDGNAAKCVMRSGAKLTLFPLDITTTIRFDIATLLDRYHILQCAIIYICGVMTNLLLPQCGRVVTTEGRHFDNSITREKVWKNMSDLSSYSLKNIKNREAKRWKAMIMKSEKKSI
jgi:hypothetical protein